MRLPRLLFSLIATLTPVAAQTPYSTLIPFPKAASCVLKIVGTFDGANAASIKTYSEAGALLNTTAADVSTRKTVTHSIPSTADVASVVIESANGTAVLAQCQEIIGWWPGLFFTFRPIVSNFTLQGDDFRSKGFPLTVGSGIRTTPVIQYSDTPTAATVDIKTGPYAVQQILSRNGTGRSSMDALLGTSVMVNAQTATARIAQPDTGSLAGYERIYTGLTSYILPHGEADYEHVLPNHYSNIGADWINLVSVLANKPTVVYFTAKSGDGKTLDVQRRVLKQDERFIAYPENIFATTKDLAWILIRADQRVETTSFYIQGMRIMTVNGLTRNECGKRLVSSGAGKSSLEAIVTLTPEILGNGFVGDRKPPAAVSIFGYDADGKLLGSKNVTIPFEGSVVTTGRLAAFLGLSPTAITSLSSVVYQSSERICITGIRATDPGTGDGDGAYKSLPTDPVLANISIRDHHYNPRTGEFVATGPESVVVIEFSGAVNPPYTQIASMSTRLNSESIYGTSSHTGDLRASVVSSSSTRRLMLEGTTVEPVEYFCGLMPQRITTSVRLQSGQVQDVVQYPPWIRFTCNPSYNVDQLLGAGAAKRIIKADIQGFAKLMSDQTGFVSPVGTFDNRVRALISSTDGNLANDELSNISLVNTSLAFRLVYGLLRDGTELLLAYDLTRDSAGEQKMRDFIHFFGVEPALQY